MVIEILVGLLIFILVFAILREVLMWYWKINEMCDLLEKIEQNTRPKGTVANPLSIPENQ
jgi:hypothetical protein